jgi:hypothetical protein
MGDAGSVRVDPEALRKYGLEMYLKGPMQTLPVLQSLSKIGPLIQSLTRPTDAGTFAEGAVIAGIIMQYVSDFQAFTNDLTNGLRDIGSAAAVTATAYRNGDVESAQDIGVINFAFGDPTAGKPEGLTGHNDTYLDDASARASAQVSMAALGNDAFITSTVNLGYMTICIYEDGSEKTINSEPSRVAGVNGYTDTTTITDANGKAIRTTTVTTGTDPQGRKVTVNSDEQNGGTSTTRTTQNSDGSITVESTYPGPDGKPVTTSVTTAPDTGGGSDAGPVQQTEKQYNLLQDGW